MENLSKEISNVDKRITTEYDEIKNYVNLISFDDIMKICHVLYGPYKFCKADFNKKLSFNYAKDDCKATNNYAVYKMDNSDLADNGIKFSLCSEDGRFFTIDFAVLKENYYLNIIYKLSDKHNILFHFCRRKDYKSDNRFPYEGFKKEDISFIKYDSLKFKKSLVPLYRTVSRYHKVKISPELFNVHKMIVDSLFSMTFSHDELNKFYKTLKESSPLLDPEKIYIALVKGGIVR